MASSFGFDAVQLDPSTGRPSARPAGGARRPPAAANVRRTQGNDVEGKRAMKRIVVALTCGQPARRLQPLRGRQRPAHADRRRPHRGAQHRSRGRGRSGAGRHAGHRAGSDRQRRLGAARRQCRPSRWPMSRSAPRRPGRGASASARGSSPAARLAAEPVVADGRVYTIDTRGDGPRVQRRQRRRSLGDPGARRERAERDPVRRRRQLRQWPASTPPTAPAMPPRSTPPPARRSGGASRAARCAAPRPSPTAASM